VVRSRQGGEAENQLIQEGPRRWPAIC
jgi:hypothetical protein